MVSRVCSKVAAHETRETGQMETIDANVTPTDRTKSLLDRAATHGVVDSASVLALLLERGEAAAARLESGLCSEVEAIALRGDLALTVAALRVGGSKLSASDPADQTG